MQKSKSYGLLFLYSNLQKLIALHFITTFTDGICASRLVNDAASAALAVVSPLVTFSKMIVCFIQIGTQILTSKKLAQGDIEGAKESIRNLPGNNSIGRRSSTRYILVASVSIVAIISAFLLSLYLKCLLL